MRRWCPNCRAEYVEGWGLCTSCGVALVDSSGAPAAGDPGPALVRGHDDPFIPIWEGPTVEAEHVQLRLEAEHIPVDLGDALEPGHARVEIPRSYLEEARDVLAGETTSWPPPLTAETTGGLDWNPNVKLALVVVAIILLLVVLVM